MEFLPEELEANVERYADFFEGHKISHTAGNAMDDAKQTIATMLGVAVIALGVALLVNGGPATTANASHEPAEKAAVSGSSLEIMESTTANGSFSEVHTLLTTEMRTSNPTDLILQFTNECALWTDVTTVGNASDNAAIRVDTRNRCLFENLCVHQQGPDRHGILLADSEGNVVRDSVLDVTGEPIVLDNASARRSDLSTARGAGAGGCR